MTVAPITPTTVLALTGSDLGPFQTSFPFEQTSDVWVWLQLDPTGALPLQLLGAPTDYTIAAPDPLANGGQVTLSAALLPAGGWVIGQELRMERHTATGQPTALGDQTGFQPSTYEAALDHLSRQVQDAEAGDASTSLGLVFPQMSFVAPELQPYLPALGPRGMLFVWNDPSTNLDGQNAGAQIWVGNNPTATPAANNFIALTTVMVNGNNRGQLWGQNIVVDQGDYPAGTIGGPFVDGDIVGLEIDMGSAWSSSLDPFLYDGGFAKTALQLFVDYGSVTVTNAITIWANDASGASWWNEGIAVSRVLHTGLHFYANPSGVTDTGVSFGTAAIYDQSNSAAVLKVDGAHGSIFDFSGLTNTSSPMFHMPPGFASNMLLTNLGDYNTGITIDSGKTAAQQSILGFSDRVAIKWELVKDAANYLSVYNLGTAHTLLTFSPADLITLPRMPTAASYANDAAAATGGVPVGGLYRNGSVVQCRIV